MASGDSGTAGSRCSSCHQEPVSCRLLALLASFSVVSPSVMAPRGSGLLSYQLDSLRGLRAPLLERASSSQQTRLAHVFILNKADQGNGVSHWPNLGHVLIPVSLSRAKWIESGEGVVLGRNIKKLLPHNGGLGAGKAAPQHKGPRPRHCLLAPLSRDHGVLCPVSWPDRKLQGPETSSFISSPKADAAQFPAGDNTAAVVSTP